MKSYCILEKIITNKKTLILSDAINAMRKTGLVWYYFESDKDYIIAVSGAKPKLARNCIPGMTWIRVNKNTGKTEAIPMQLLANPENDKLMKSFKKGVKFVDITFEEYKEWI